MNRAESAMATFDAGYSCAQAVYSSFCDEAGISRDMALKISTGFGGGIARHGEVCGAVSGAVLAIGSVLGRGEFDEKQKMVTTYETTQDLFKQFSSKMGSVNCKELLNGCDLLTPEGRNEFGEMGLWDSVCAPCVKCAAEITDRLLEEQLIGGRSCNS